MVTAGTLADLYVAGPGGVTFTGESTTSTDSMTFTIANATKKYWDKSAGLQVYVGGSLVTGGYAVAWGSGMVIFPVAQTGGVTVSGKYLTISQAGNATDWALDVDAAAVDTSTFGTGWRTYQQIMRGFSVTFGRFYIDNYFANLVGQPIIMVLYINKTANTRYECAGWLNKDSVKDTATGLVQENISLSGDGVLVFAAS